MDHVSIWIGINLDYKVSVTRETIKHSQIKQKYMKYTLSERILKKLIIEGSIFEASMKDDTYGHVLMGDIFNIENQFRTNAEFLQTFISMN